MVGTSKYMRKIDKNAGTHDSRPTRSLRTELNRSVAEVVHLEQNPFRYESEQCYLRVEEQHRSVARTYRVGKYQ